MKKQSILTFSWKKFTKIKFTSQENTATKYLVNNA